MAARGRRGPHRRLLAAAAAAFLSAGVPRGASAAAGEAQVAGEYVALEWLDNKRVMMRVPKGASLPPIEEELMLEELENWKWRVETAAADAAVLVSFSYCPHGLGLLPSALSWVGNGRWRQWPGTFEYQKGQLEPSPEEAPSWVEISKNRACEGAPGIRMLAQSTLNSLQECFQECDGNKECAAVDYYRASKFCALYDAACASPQKSHDGASSHRKDGVERLSFTGAKQRCQELEDCKGFSYEDVWSDKDRESGVARLVLFSGSDRLAQSAGKWHSWVRKDNPRAACNPEGEAFQCPNNPYACLGLSMDADDEAVKQAYRGLSRRMHPDKIPANKRTPQAVKEAEQRFRQISDANELLRDPQERRKADQRLMHQRRQWEKQKAEEADLYIKEPKVSSLEPESYPVLIPKGQEWIVHFFLPTNDDCKQMKMAMGRVVAELGNGEEERGLPSPPQPQIGVSFRRGDVFRGSLREKSSGLRNEGAQSQEGDTRLTLVVEEGGKAKLWIQNDVMDVQIEREGGPFKLVGTHRIFTGTFDKHPAWFRGGVAAADAAATDTASFVLGRDTWTEPPRGVAARPGSRQKPRLFGAVNCGRFRDFCKKKGVDPAITKRFPQVRVLFPEQGRFEVYHGRPLGRELAAFARESSRTPVAVPELEASNLTGLEAGPSKPWLVLLKKEPKEKKKKLDCELCKASLPMLGRSAPRLLQAGVQVAWANCTEPTEFCDRLGANEDDSTWGALRLVEIGGSRVSAPQALWDARLVAGEMSQSGLLAALESAARTAEFMAGLAPAAAAEARGASAPRSEL